MPHNQPVTLRAPLIVGFVIIVSLIGMLLGGAFGYAAGTIGPDLFRNLIPWEEYEPVGTATVVGAFGGVMCGAGLGAFAIAVQLIVTLASQDRAARQS